MQPKGPDIIPAWQAAARDLRIRVAASKTLSHADGTTIIYPIHLSEFGARNGALLWPDYQFDDIDPVERVAHYWSCSYAVINPDFYSVYDRALFASFLCRLGIHYPQSQWPTWYADAYKHRDDAYA